MKTFKKLLAMLLALAMVFAMAACELNSSDDDDDDKKSKEEKFLSELEDLLDDILDALEDGDEDKVRDLYDELEDLQEEYEEILEELEEDDEDKAEEFAEDFEKLFEKFEEKAEEIEENDDGDKKTDRPQRDEIAVEPTMIEPEWEETQPIIYEEVPVADITGEWSYELDLSETFSASLDASAGVEVAPYNALYMDVTLEFDSNGRYKMEMELDEDSAEDYYEALLLNMVDLCEASLIDSGSSKAEFEAQAGMTLYEYCKQTMDEVWDNAMASIVFETVSGYYQVDGSYIHTASYKRDLGNWENYMEFSVSGYYLTIYKLVENGEDLSDAGNQMGMTMPWVFTKD